MDARSRSPPAALRAPALDRGRVGVGGADRRRDAQQVTREVSAAGVELHHHAGRRARPPPSRRRPAPRSPSGRPARTHRPATASGGARALGDVDLRPPQRRLAAQRQPHDTGGARTDRSPAARAPRWSDRRERRSTRTPSLPACTSSSTPGGQAARQRAQGRQRAPELRRRTADRPPRRRCRGTCARESPASRPPRPTSRARSRYPNGGPAAMTGGISIPSARSTIAFFAACCASALTCCHWQPPHAPNSGHGGATRSGPGRSISISSRPGHLLLGALDARAHPFARRRQRHERHPTVRRPRARPPRSRCRPTASPPGASDSTSTLTSARPSTEPIYGNPWAARPRAKSKSKKPSRTPPDARRPAAACSSLAP